MPGIIRLVGAPQTTDKLKVSTPANWQPEDKAIVPPQKTTAEMEKRLTEGYDCTDWYLCF
jgi:peroxiredoxin (alkyl hydroperoxide reductase subunit C)